MSSRVLLSAFLFLISLTFSAACSDPAPVNPVSGAADNPDNDLPIPPREEPQPEPEPGLPCCVLSSALPDGEVIVQNGDSATLGVYLRDRETGAGVASEAISWSSLGGGAGMVSAGSTLTDTAGLAEVRFEAGADVIVYTVEASYPDTAPVSFRVRVLALETGAIRVTVRHDRQRLVEVTEALVQVYEASAVECDDMRPGGVFDAPVATQTLSDIATQSALFESVPAGRDYTVAVVGNDAAGGVVATGCVDAVAVEQDRLEGIVVDLELLPLNPQGDYTLITDYDFTEALLMGGEIGGVVAEAMSLFDNPGLALQGYMLDVLESWLGTWIDDVETFLFVTGLDLMIADAINAEINANEGLRDIFAIGCDLRRMVARLHVESDLEVGKLESDFEVSGIQRVTGIAVCDFEPDPDFVVGHCDELPACDLLPLDLEDIGDDVFTMREQAFEGDWEGTVTDYDQLTIGEHEIDFNYGVVILSVLSNYLLPELAGVDGPLGIDEYVSTLIDCDDLAYSITGGGEICLVACVSTDDLAGLCETGINLVFGTLLENFVASLQLEAAITVELGSATLINNDDDLDVELLEDGVFEGNISVLEAAPFTATFTGQRVEE